MRQLCQKVMVGMGITGLLVSGERSTLVARSPYRLEASQLPQASTQQPVVRLCPVGGERYPEEARGCPIHHVPLTELMLARLRLEERSSHD
ncbi:MAG: hypothetical protein A2Z92_04855 [Omnitrophica WOR_2 bacterium GWA2_63_20]|nr:MAG: hypothetical protein A2Z92_04855 [Omnitrophica WOR_2 bacterium GWA2_63_20]OGX17498.1 MAG: hypothetical protein A2105_01365 [Omnitrophica WOR_2 bacterium GWF2_63_9]HBQ38946.1 hypothetical protein [Candidatus Omnitrophota bacterium]